MSDDFIYEVALKEGVDYEQFWHEMETSYGSATIPARSVDIVDDLNPFKRICEYAITAAEAEALRADPRVEYVTRPTRLLDLPIAHCARVSSPYSMLNSSINVSNYTVAGNWGIQRLQQPDYVFPKSSVDSEYTYPIDGTGVDIVIQDGGVQWNHPDFYDANGNNRFIDLQWYTASGLGSTQLNYQTTYNDTYGHGTHCAGIAAGLRYGRAKGSLIYSLYVDGLGGNNTVGLPASLSYQLLLGWHNNKEIDPALGYKRPTVVNMSWGYFWYFANIASGVYRGTSWTGSTRRSDYGMVGKSDISGNVFGNINATIDLRVSECIAAGIHMVGAAGNYYQRVDVPGGDDYDNRFTNTTGSVFYYNRGGSPGNSPGVITVGNMDAVYNNNAGPEPYVEQKAVSSEAGPNVDVWAPGTYIISDCSTTNVFGSTSLYPGSNTYRICSISGTSMAAPQVCGLAAQLLQVYPTITPTQLRQKIIDLSVTKPSDEFYDTGLTNDYTDTRSLRGGPRRIAQSPFTQAETHTVTGGVSFQNTGV